MTHTSFPENIPLDTPTKEWPACPKCGEKRGKQQHCRNGCDTWTANNVGSWYGTGWSAGQGRGGIGRSLREEE